jgi:myosin-3
VLHLGQVKFTTKAEHAAIAAGSQGAVKNAAKFLGVDEEKLGESLTSKFINVPGESKPVQVAYSVDEAEGATEATARALYGKLFSWMTLNINQLLNPPAQAASRKAVRGAASGRASIGILDIFGFEDFNSNSFEQLCINLANEQLQFFFNEHVFAYEQKEYEKEGVDASNISYKDNKPLLEMHFGLPKGELGKKGHTVALFEKLDDACKIAKCQPYELVTMFDKEYKAEKFADIYRAKKGENQFFTICHYAGDVEYNAMSFLDKNRDLLSATVVEVMQRSTSLVVAELFLVRTNPETGAVEAVVNRSDDDAVKRKKLKAAIDAFDHKSKPVTIGLQFRKSLNLLYTKMAQCKPHFIRCIKPNTEKSPWNFQDDFVVKQLQYTGMLATTRIRREGYAVRPRFQEFIQRFRVLGFDRADKLDFTAANCRVILKAAGVDHALMGKTKVFLKHYDMDALEAEVLQWAIAATMVQKHWRAWKAKQLFKKEKEMEAEREIQKAEFMTDMLAHSDQWSKRANSHVAEDDIRYEEERKRIQEQLDRERREREEAAARAQREREEKARREQREREEAQRALQQEEQNRIKKEYSVAEAEIDRLIASIRQTAQNRGDIRPLITELAEKLRDREAQMGTQISKAKDGLSEVRTQVKLKQQETVDLVSERDSIVRQISNKALTGGQSAPDAIKTLSAKLDSQETLVQDAQAESRTLALRVESQNNIVELVQGQQMTVVSKVNRALEECNQYTLAWCDDNQAALDAAAAKAKSSAETHAEAMARIEQELREQTELLERQRAEEAATKEAARSELMDKAGTNAQLQDVLQKAEVEIRELTMQVATHKEDHATTKATAAKSASTAAAEAKRQLEQAASTADQAKLAAVKKSQAAESESKATIRQLEAEKQALTDEVSVTRRQADQAKLKAQNELLQVQTELDDRMLDIQDMSAKIERTGRMAQTEIADKDDALAGLESKASALVAEREQAHRQQSELKAKVRQLQNELDEAVDKSERMLQQHASALRVAAASTSRNVESSAVSDELRALLAQKSQIATLRHEEHERLAAKLQATIMEQAAQIGSLRSEATADLDNLRSELRARERAALAQGAETGAAGQALQAKNVKLMADLATASSAAAQAKIRLQESQSEVASLTSRLETNAELFELLKGENLTALAEFQRLHTERNATEAKRVADEQAARHEIERENRGLQTQLQVATAALDSAKQEYRRYHDELTRDHDDQISKLEQILSDQKEALEGLRAREAALKERAMQLQHQLDEDTATFQKNSEELMILREALGESTLREQREKERSLTLHEQAMRDLESRLSMQSEAQKKNFLQLKKAIVKMARKRPGNSAPGEGAHVDLHNYITMIKGEAGIPHSIRVGRFTVKSYLVKMAAQVEQHRWLVLDLQQKTMSWFVDNRELRISRKGTWLVFKLHI